MTSKHPRNIGPVRTPPPADPNAGNRPPIDPRTPEPRADGDNNRPTIKTWQDVLKIMVAVTVWFATTDAVSALREAARYVELSKVMSLLHFPLGSLPNTVTWGLTIGAVHGLILGVKALVFIWVGPTFFEYLYPVFVAASRFSARAVNDVRRAWVMGPSWRQTPPGRDNDPTDGTRPPTDPGTTPPPAPGTTPPAGTLPADGAATTEPGANNPDRPQ
jgi:hypothetical protein